MLPGNIGTSAYLGSVNTLFSPIGPKRRSVSCGGRTTLNSLCDFLLSPSTQGETNQARRLSTTDAPNNMALVEPESTADRYDVLEIIGKV
jgi:hypothetical protein